MPGKGDLVPVSEAAARSGYTTQQITRLLGRGKVAGR